MKVVLDESIERQVAEAVKNAGHETWYISDLQSGIADEQVLDIANKNNALLITADNLNFADHDAQQVPRTAPNLPFSSSKHTEYISFKT